MVHNVLTTNPLGAYSGLMLDSYEPIEHPGHETAMRTERLNLRLAEEQKRLVAAAAALMHKTLSEFVLDAACTLARETLAAQTHFEVDAETYDRFLAVLDAPTTTDKPLLRKLLTEPSVFDEAD